MELSKDFAVEKFLLKRNVADELLEYFTVPS